MFFFWDHSLQISSSQSWINSWLLSWDRFSQGQSQFSQQGVLWLCYCQNWWHQVHLCKTIVHIQLHNQVNQVLYGINSSPGSASSSTKLWIQWGALLYMTLITTKDFKLLYFSRINYSGGSSGQRLWLWI